LWDPSDLPLWDPLWDSSGINGTRSHVTRDTHVGLGFRGWLDCLVFILAFSLACSSTWRAIPPLDKPRCKQVETAARNRLLLRPFCDHGLVAISRALPLVFACSVEMEFLGAAVDAGGNTVLRESLISSSFNELGRKELPDAGLVGTGVGADQTGAGAAVDIGGFAALIYPLNLCFRC
jgi:hypothetical protein